MRSERLPASLLAAIVAALALALCGAHGLVERGAALVLGQGAGALPGMQEDPRAA